MSVVDVNDGIRTHSDGKRHIEWLIKITGKKNTREMAIECN